MDHPYTVVEHRRKFQSVIAWGRICPSGLTPLIFVNQGVKINQEQATRFGLLGMLQHAAFSWSRIHFGSRYCPFQQDSAPAHSAQLPQHNSVLVQDPFS